MSRFEQATREVVRKLNREECVKLLTDNGFQCYDSESLSVLQDAIEANILDGTILRNAIADSDWSLKCRDSEHPSFS